MAIDTSIYGNALRAGPSFQEQVAGYQGIESNKTQNLLQRQALDQNAMKMQMAQQSMQRQAAASAAQNQAIKSALNPDGTLDQNKYRMALAQAGQGALIPETDSKYAVTNKEQSTADKNNIDTQVNHLKVAGQLLDSVTDQASLDRARAQAQSIGFKLDGVPEQYNPQQIQQLKGMALSTLEKLNQQNKQTEMTETGRHNMSTEGAAYMNANAAMMNANTSRDRLSEDKNSNSLGTFNPELGGFVSSKTGLLTPAKTQSGQNVLNKDQQKVQNDAKEALSILDQAEPLINQGTGSYLGYSRNLLSNEVGLGKREAEANSSLKSLEASLIGRMPKTGGSQVSDGDIKMYREAAGNIGDPTKSKVAKIAAMKTIREVMQRALTPKDDSQGASAPASATSLPQGWSITPVK